MNNTLENLKVLDLTRVLSGPYCGMNLADLGADVLKIEMPGKGDDARAFGPHINGESTYFMSLNRNKRSLTLNLKTEDGKAILRKLVKDADILVENYKPGTMTKLGLGYEELKKINPRLIYAAISGFGYTGPYSDRPAYDGIIQAMSGIMSVTGEAGGTPTRVGPSIGDIVAGMYGTIGILGAVNYRAETGKGQMVDVAMLDCQVSILENALARYFATGISPKPAGNKHTSIVPFEPFTTADGELVVAAGNDKLFALFCTQLGCPELIEDARFKHNIDRFNHYDELRPLLANKMQTKPTAFWQDCLDKAGVPNGPINNIEQVVQDVQVKAREMIVPITHPVAGETQLPGVPIKFSESPASVKSAAPVLGSSNFDVLGELGYSADEIKALEEKKVI